jgi:hypothetical protein
MSEETPGAARPVPVETDFTRGADHSEPHVGLFYLIHGQVYWEGIPVSSADGTPYFKSYPKTHAQYWKETLLRRIPSLSGYDSSSFPRGRVVFDKTKDTYDLIADNCIIDSPLVMERIVSEMGLPEEKVKTSRDVNFECSECRTARERETYAPIDPIKEQFKHTREGQAVFFPWYPFGAGYIVHSKKMLKRLRRQSAVANVIAVSLWLGATRLVVHHMNGLTMVATSLLVFVSYLIGFRIWVRYQCSGMTKIDRETAAR